MNTEVEKNPTNNLHCPLQENIHDLVRLKLNLSSEDVFPATKVDVENSMYHSDATLKFITQILMEEDDLENIPCMLYECLALQITQESFHHVLINEDDVDQNDKDCFLVNSCKNKTRCREDSDEDHGSNKHLASNVDEIESLDMCDSLLLFSNSADRIEASKREKPRGRCSGSRQGVTEDIVDLGSLLMQCAKAVATFDSAAVDNLFLRISRYSSPQGNGMERLAHYFTNALYVRLIGNGSMLDPTAAPEIVTAAQGLRAHKAFITACPFINMSYSLANKTIFKKLDTRVTRLHIIDFGILYGFQWPSLIQILSERPGGPPMLRITGIDFPQSGFRPAQRVKDTGRLLAMYCERFGVPFEYIAIAQNWETIRVEDLKIDKDEFVVVNSLFRLHNVLDETEMVNNPRDKVLNLIKKINPEMFIHGVVSCTYNRPFFLMRFKEALYHFSSMFDMFDATMSREDEDRMLFEKVYGNLAMNVIACEGRQRIERPETYKQSRVRNVRAGFRQLPLDREIVEYVRSKVKTDYHKDFTVEEDGKWMLQGWKGRTFYAISCWGTTHN